MNIVFLWWRKRDFYSDYGKSCQENWSIIYKSSDLKDRLEMGNLFSIHLVNKFVHKEKLGQNFVLVSVILKNSLPVPTFRFFLALFLFKKMSLEKFEKKIGFVIYYFIGIY